MTKIPQKEFLTVSEVAQVFSVSPLTVRNWDRAGKLEATRNPFNNYRVYRRVDIETLLGEIEFSKGKRMAIPHAKKKVRKLSVRSEE
ncbi:MAG: MerR family transcriptional regulator [Patescibacteria group bacterium]